MHNSNKKQQNHYIVLSVIKVAEKSNSLNFGSIFVQAIYAKNLMPFCGLKRSKNQRTKVSSVELKTQLMYKKLC